MILPGMLLVDLKVDIEPVVYEMEAEISPVEYEMDVGNIDEEIDFNLGSWVRQSDLTSVFDANTNYMKG